MKQDSLAKGGGRRGGRAGVRVSPGVIDKRRIYGSVRMKRASERAVPRCVLEAKSRVGDAQPDAETAQLFSYEERCLASRRGRWKSDRPRPIRHVLAGERKRKCAALDDGDDVAVSPHFESGDIGSRRHRHRMRRQVFCVEERVTDRELVTRNSAAPTYPWRLWEKR